MPEGPILVGPRSLSHLHRVSYSEGVSVGGRTLTTTDGSHAGHLSGHTIASSPARSVNCISGAGLLLSGPASLIGNRRPLRNDDA